MATNQSKFWQKSLVRYLIVALIFAVILPLVFKLLHIAVTWRVGLLFMLVDPIVALWLGRDIAKHHQKWYTMLIFPVIFTIMVVIFYAPYNLWFGLIYLLLTYLGTSMETTIYKQAN